MPLATTRTVETSRLPINRSRTGVVYALIGLIGFVFVLLYGSVVVELVRDWLSEPSLSYGLLVPPLAMYFAWMGRHSISAEAVKPDSRGLLLVGFTCVLYLLGELGVEPFLQRMSLVLLPAALVWTFWGLARLKRLAFPLVLLAAMVPLPAFVYSSLAPHLQLLASDIAADTSRFVGVSIYRDGNILQLARTSLAVEEACSGLSSLPSLMVGSLLLGNLFCTRLHTKVLLFVSAVPIAIAANVLRVAGTAVLADYREELAMGFYHFFAGWMVSLLGFAGLYLAAKFFTRLLETPTG